MNSLDDWLAHIERQHPQSIAMGLERVRDVAMRMGLGRPAPQVVTVGGTNGKGSTVAFIEAIARAAGWRVGAYTSPHLLAYNERVRIDGRDVDDASLVAAFEAVEAARSSPSPNGRGVGVRVQQSRDGSAASDIARPSSGPSDRALQEGEGNTIPLTYFEYGTLAALQLFADSDLDLAILEVGLGGRLDAVNLVDPDVAVITTVDLDHQHWLGDDREAIGLEKAGIARAGTPLVLGEDDPPASVLRHAYRIGAPAIRAGSDFLFERRDAATWRWREPGFDLVLPLPRLAAPAQLRNAATAIAALRALDRAVPESAWAAGVANATLPGRLQRCAREGVDIVVDVGHNPQAARELAAWLRSTPVDGRTHAIYAALADKDVVGVVAALAPEIDGWHLAGLVEAGSRGADVDRFAARLVTTAAAEARRHATAADALREVQGEARAGDRILVFGSFHTAAAALRMLSDD